MFKYYPLEFSDVEEAMMKIETHVVEGKSYVSGSLYALWNENSEEHDENRYDSIPFFSKRVAKDDYPEIIDFVDWINLFGDMYEESRN